MLQPEERALSRWHSLAGFGSWSLPTNTSWGIPNIPCPGAGLAALGKSWYWGENQSIKGLYSGTFTHQPSQMCPPWPLAAPHRPFQLSQCQQAAAPRPRHRCQHRGPGSRRTAVGHHLPCLGRPAAGLNSPGKGGRKIAKTIRRICFMLPGSFPARSSVFGRPIYNQQCGML